MATGLRPQKRMHRSALLSCRICWSGSARPLTLRCHCVPGARRLLSWCRELRPDRAGALAVLHGHSLHWRWLGNGARPTRFFCRTARHWPARRLGLADRRQLCRARAARAVRCSVREPNRHQPAPQGCRRRSSGCGHRRGALTGLTPTTETRFMTHDVTSDQVFQIGLGFRASKVLLSAVELGVFTVVGPAMATLSR
jgi:hypothetical protein